MEKLFIILAIIGGIVVGGILITKRSGIDSQPFVTPAQEATATPRPTASPQKTQVPQRTQAPQQTQAPTPVPTQQAQQPTVRTFVLSADDNGYTPSGAIQATSGDTVRVTFNVSTQNVYFSGLEFRGGPVNTGSIPPGGTKTVEFTADSDFTITAYWPSSGVIKFKIPVQISSQ